MSVDGWRLDAIYDAEEDVEEDWDLWVAMAVMD